MINLIRTRWKDRVRKRLQKRVMNALPIEKLESMLSKYAPEESLRSDRTEFFKYLNINNAVKVNVDRAIRLGLHKEKKPLRVLDLGCGFGWFLFTCQVLGHDAVGVDIHDEEVPHCRMFAEAMETLGTKRQVHQVQSDDCLPDLKGKFDWVTAWQIQFNKTEGGRNDQDDDIKFNERWGPNQWQSLSNAISEISETQGSQVYLRLNKPDCWDTWYSPDLLDWFQAQDAEVEGPYIRYCVNAK
ncbi:MAG: methyltransferase domain-containing protein [Gimesia sp.]